MASKRKATKIVQKPHYVVEDYRNPPKNQVLRYRRKKVGSHILNIAVLKKEGPRGGRTVVTSVWHPKTERKSSNPSVTKALRRKSKSR